MVAVEGRDRVTGQRMSLPVVSRAAVVLVLGIAGAAVLGWFIDEPTLGSFVPGYTAMKFNTALCLLGLASSVLVRRPLVMLIVLPVLTLLAATMAEIVSRASFGIDQLIVSDPHPPHGPSGQMAPATCVALLILGLSVVSLRFGKYRMAETLLVVPLMMGLVTLLGYFFDAAELYRVDSLSSVAVSTAVAVVLLTIAVAGRIHHGLLPWAMSGTGPGALVLRQTVPVVALGLTLLGSLVKFLEDRSRFDTHFGTALMVLIGSLIAVAATVRAARRLDVSHAARTNAERALRELNASLVAGRDAAWARGEALADELAEERARFDRAVSGIHDIVWTAETTGGTAELGYASPNTEGIFGRQLPPGADFTQMMAELVDPEDRSVRDEFYSRMLAGLPAEMEIRVRGLDGQMRWVWARGAPRVEGSRTFYDGITTDITDRRILSDQRERLLEQERLQVERLSELSRVRDEFIAVAGHELRTPVAVILGYCELLADPHLGPTIRQQAIEVISRRATELSKVVERVFDLARLDAGALDLDVELIELGPFIEALIADHQPAAAAAGVAVQVSSVDGTLWADRARLRQIFDNLFSNAFKYASPGGHVRLDVTDAGDDLRFELSDDGIGVPDEELPRLFERLYRASTAREARIPGTGLGLAVTRALVEAHGGSLTARANQPQGLVISMVMPKVPAVQPVGAAEPSQVVG